MRKIAQENEESRMEQSKLNRKRYLIYKYLNTLERDMVVKIFKSFKLTVAGYMNIEKSVTTRNELLEKMLDILLKHPTRMKKDKESYDNLKQKKLVDYHIQVICDILHERSRELLEEQLGKEFFVIPEDFDKDVDIVDTSNEQEVSDGQLTHRMTNDVAKIKMDLDKCKKENDKLVAKLKKCEEQKASKEKEIIALKNKVTEIKQKNKEAYSEMMKVGLVAKEKEKLLAEISEYKKKLEEYEEYKTKTYYFEQLKHIKKVLLIDIKPKVDKSFPYDYATVFQKDGQYVFPNGNFTEVWYCGEVYGKLQLAGIRQDVFMKYGRLEFVQFDIDWLRKLGLEETK